MRRVGVGRHAARAANVRAVAMPRDRGASTLTMAVQCCCWLCDLAAAVGCCSSCTTWRLGRMSKQQQELEGCEQTQILARHAAAAAMGAPASAGGSGRPVTIRNAAACTARTSAALARRAKRPMGGVKGPIANEHSGLARVHPARAAGGRRRQAADEFMDGGQHSWHFNAAARGVRRPSGPAELLGKLLHPGRPERCLGFSPLRKDCQAVLMCLQAQGGRKSKRPSKRPSQTRGRASAAAVVKRLSQVFDPERNWRAGDARGSHAGGRARLPPCALWRMLPRVTCNMSTGSPTLP